jgi:hypothetical protein
MTLVRKQLSVNANTDQIDIAVMLLACILEVFDSNLDHDTCYI